MQQAVAVNTPEELEQSLRGDTKSVYSVHVGLLETILHGDQFGFLEESTKDLAQVGLKITKVWRMHHKVFPSPNAMDNPTLVFVVETFDNIYKWLSTGRCYDAISRTCRGLPRIDLCSSIATLDANRSPDDIWLCACVFPFKRAAKEEYKGFKRDYIICDVSNNKSTYGVSNPEALAPLYLIRVAQDPNSPIVYPPAVPDYVPTEAPAGDVKDEVKKEEVKSEDVEMGAAPPQQQQQQQQPTSEMSQDGIVLPILPSELTEATIMFHTPKLFDVHIDITIPADVCTREANIIDTFIRTDVVNAVHKAVSGPKIEWRVLKEQSGSSVTIEVYTPDSGSQDTKAKYESEYIPFCEFNQNVELPDSFAN